MEEKEEGMDAEQEMLFSLVEREDILEYFKSFPGLSMPLGLASLIREAPAHISHVGVGHTLLLNNLMRKDLAVPTSSGLFK